MGIPLPPLPTSLHQPVLNLVVCCRHRDEILHLLLVFSIRNLPQKGCLLFWCMTDCHPPLGLIVHLPGPGRDSVRWSGHLVVLRIEVGYHFVLLGLCSELQCLGDLFLHQDLFLLLDSLGLLPVLPVGKQRCH